MNDEKIDRVLEAARRVFVRYGFRRVTMQEIAQEAGMSRPALYLIFPNKEEIFLAAIRDFTDQNMLRIRAGLTEHVTLDAKLRFAFEVWTVEAYALMESSPDAKELIDCVLGFARETFRQITADFEQMLAEVIAPYLPKSNTQPPQSAQEIARLLSASTHGFKESATGVEDLRGMIGGLISLIVTAISAGISARPGN
jgi:AcrR family transcriptional regulator